MYFLYGFTEFLIKRCLATSSGPLYAVMHWNHDTNYKLAVRSGQVELEVKIERLAAFNWV